MRVLSILLLLASSAIAAEPGEELFANKRLSSERFPDSDEEGPSFAPGDKLVVLVEEGDRLRVLGPQNKIGWIDVDGASTLFALPDDLRGQVLQDLMGGQGVPAGLPVGR